MGVTISIRGLARALPLDDPTAGTAPASSGLLTVLERSDDAAGRLARTALLSILDIVAKTLLAAPLSLLAVVATRQVAAAGRETAKALEPTHLPARAVLRRFHYASLVLQAAAPDLSTTFRLGAIAA